MQDKIFENEYFYILKENSHIPWVKIFSQKPYKELSQCDEQTKNALLTCMLEVEKAMLEFYNPTKINIAIFGNYVPHVHIHVMARFELDSHFPESMWGVKQREAQIELCDFEDFMEFLKKRLSKN
ncbi:MAG: HIT family protein [Sulfurospirillaceae bacterium]|nr:HIT family protein [Sulfurospirillaceae bacterium]